MTLPELAEATGLSKSSVQRFTHTLWTYLRRSRQQEVLAGTLVAGTGHEVRADQSAGAGRQSVPSFAQPQLPGNLQPGRARVGHGVRGAFRHAQGNVREHAGRHAPAAVLHGGGRAVLSRLDPDVAHWLLERSDRRSHTAATITGMDALLAELEFARRHGYARNGEFYPGDITVSAAVLDAGGIPWARSMCRFHPAAGRSNRRRPCLVRRWSKPRMPSACRAPWDVLIPSTSWSLPAARCATPISVAGEA